MCVCVCVAEGGKSVCSLLRCDQVAHTYSKEVWATRDLSFWPPEYHSPPKPLLAESRLKMSIINIFKEGISFQLIVWKNPSSKVKEKFLKQWVKHFIVCFSLHSLAYKSAKLDKDMLLVVCVRLPYLPCRSDRRGWKHLSHKQTTCPHSAAAGPWWNCDTRPSETEMRAMQHLKLSTFGRALIVRDVYICNIYIYMWMDE